MHDMNQIIPQFANEAEEAAWRFDNTDQLDDEVGNFVGDSVDIDPADLKLACALAEKKGLEYETYIKMVIHEALLKEENAA